MLIFYIAATADIFKKKTTVTQCQDFKLLFLFFIAIVQTLDEIPLEAENAEKGYADTTGLSKVHNLPPSFYDTTPKSNRSRKSHSGEQQPSFLHSHADANGLGSYSPIGI